LSEETGNNDKNRQTESKNQAPTMKPMEMKLTNSVFVKMRKNMVLFKVLSDSSMHYSLFSYGSTLDLHSTYENRSGKNEHHQLIKMDVDWLFLYNRIAQDIIAYSSLLLKKIKSSDLEFSDLKIEYFSAEMLKELMANALGQNRWNVDQDFFDKFEASLEYGRLGELTGENIKVGWSSEGFIVIAYKDECWILDTEMMTKILMKDFELSVRKIHLNYYTLGTLTWVAKIYLLRVNDKVTNFLAGKPNLITKVKSN
jgi:hypothetical protein